MKIVYNVEMSHVKEVVISHKVFYVKEKNEEDEQDVYVRDDVRSEDSIKKDEMPKELFSEEMAKYVRDFVGRKKWKIVFSSGTVNIFKKGTTQKSKKSNVPEPKTKKFTKKSKE
jgi:hypothetical protein